MADRNISVWIKRDDLIHPLLQGNKWRKMKFNLQQAIESQKDTLLTFGGAYSNHIAATAAAGQLFGLKTIGIIRGEPTATPSLTLQQAAANGMQLHFMERSHYRLKDEPGRIEELHYRFGDFYYLPEGGTNALALPGCEELVGEIDVPFDVMCCAAGTGGTASGLRNALHANQRLLVFPALKGEGSLPQLIANATPHAVANIEFHREYHFGGYAKITDELFQFIQYIFVHHRILLDPVYTSKMLYGVYDLILQNYFEPGTRIIAVHSGGLQGWCGFHQEWEMLKNGPAKRNIQR